MSVETIRAGIETVLAAWTASVDGKSLTIRPVQEIDDAPNVSGSAMAAVIEWGGANYLAAFNDQTNDATMRIIILAVRVSERQARRQLDLLVDPTPGSTTALRNVLNGDLGNAVGFCQVSSASQYQNYPVGQVDCLGCEFMVVIGT